MANHKFRQFEVPLRDVFTTMGIHKAQGRLSKNKIMLTADYNFWLSGVKSIVYIFKFSKFKTNDFTFTKFTLHKSIYPAENFIFITYTVIIIIKNYKITFTLKCKY